MRKQYTEKLENLKKEVLELHDKIKKNLKFIEIAIEKHSELEKIVQESQEIDQSVRKKTAQIEGLCIELLSLQHPMAKDLRFVVTVLKFLTDFERISRNTLHTLEELMKFKISEHPEYSKVLSQLLDVIDFMLQEINTAISTDTASTADVLTESDNIIDLRYEELSKKIYEDLKEEEISQRQALALTSITRYIERIGDHICNIGERWFYTEEGKKTIIK